MKSLLRFGVKAGILTSAVYYSKQVGVWEDSSRTYDLSKEFVVFLKPYVTPAVQKVNNELPFQIQELPSKDDICRTVSSGWNQGVIKSISFAKNLPCLLSTYIKQGASFIENQVKGN